MCPNDVNAPPSSAPAARGGCFGKLALVIVSTLVTLSVIEAVVRFYERRLYEKAGVFVPADPTIDGVAWEVQAADPERFRFQSGGDSLVHMKSDNPGLVYELRPNVRISDEVSTNAQGFRDGPFTVEKAPNEYRIAAVGDSITFGWTQDAAQVYVEQLEARLNAAGAPGMHYSVYNFGVGGYNAAQEVALVNANVLSYKPDLILMGYCGNDNQIGFDAGLWRHFSRTWWRTWDFAKLRWMFFQEHRQEHDLVERSYAELADVAREAGVPVLVVLFPHANDLGGSELVRRAAFFESLGMATVNLYPVFAERGMDTLMNDIVHPNTEGHTLAAAAIFTRLAGPEPPTSPGFPSR